MPPQKRESVNCLVRDLPMRNIILIIALLTLCLNGFSRDPERSQPYLQMTYHTGVYWSRTIYLDQQFSKGYRAIDARLGFQSTGKELWQQYHHYPKYGVGIHYADLIKDRTDTIMGNPFSAFLFYNAPIARVGRFSLNADIGIGLSYTSVIYDPETNPYNDLMASHINSFFDFSLNIRTRLSPRLDLSTGFGVSHYSNGRIHMPQKGVNHWGGSFALGYYFNRSGMHQSVTPGNSQFERAARIYTDPQEFNPFEELQLMVAVGVVDRQPLGSPEGEHYFTSSFTADYALRYSYKSAVTFGVDLLYDGSLEHIKGIPIEEVTTVQKTYLGSHIGYQFTVNWYTVLINLGTYFRQHSYDRGYLFTRWGSRIRLTDHLQTQITIKTKQGVRSDWIEWGLVYSVKTR